MVEQSPVRVLLEVDGETVELRGWPAGEAAPPGPVDVLGVRLDADVAVTERAGAADRSPGATASAPAPPVSAAAPSGGPGIAVLPPMPGKVLELRVTEGQTVRRGDILLVLEAMKMRNEIASPADGRVEGLRVSAGANVRGREPMLRVVPETA